MENIDHVNRFYLLRVLIFPLILLSYFRKKYVLIRMSKKYVLGIDNLNEEIRYEKLLSFHSRNLSLKNTSLYFSFNRKVTQQQQVFVVNDNLGWHSISLLKYLIQNKKQNYPKIVLNNMFIRKKLDRSKSNLWDLIDTFYGEGDIERALQSKRSFIVEKSFLDRHSGVLERIKSSHIPITPIFLFRESRNRIWYVLGDMIKTVSMVNFKASALNKNLDYSFDLLRNESRKIVEKYRKERRNAWKDVFRSTNFR